MKKAAFSLDDFRFNKVKMNFTENSTDELLIAFNPKGEFENATSKFFLTFVFKARNENSKDPFIVVECNATYIFSEKIDFSEIPPYFYVNSIAILFPYVRAFISTLTLQANIPPLVLPTMNLVDLAGQLKKKTNVK
jgi:preprotein translocase subunit SecB